MDQYSNLRVPADAVHVEPEDLARLPHSALRIFRCILDEGPLTYEEIHQRTQMPPRTMRYAIRRLRDERIVDGRMSLQDCRRCYFFIHPRLVSREHVDAQRERSDETHDLRISVQHDRPGLSPGWGRPP